MKATDFKWLCDILRIHVNMYRTKTVNLVYYLF